MGKVDFEKLHGLMTEFSLAAYQENLLEISNYFSVFLWVGLSFGLAKRQLDSAISVTKF